MRPPRDFRTASKESYEEFKAKNSHIHITFQQFKDILRTWNEMMMLYILETGKEIKLPYGMGPLTISKKVRKRFKTVKGKQMINLPVDWKKTKEEGRKIYIINHHTEGFSYCWFWAPKKSRIKYSYAWRLKIGRVYSRLLAKYLKQPNSKYKDIYMEQSRRK